MTEHIEPDPTAGPPRAWDTVTGDPIPQHVYLGVGTICDWCNLPKHFPVHIPPPPNPANEPPGPPAHDPEPPKTAWFLRDEERAEFSFLITQFEAFANPEVYKDDALVEELTTQELRSFYGRGAAAIARLLEADLENRKELERLTQEAQTLLNTIARPEAGADPSGAPPPLDAAAVRANPANEFYRPLPPRGAAWDAAEQYAKDLIGLKDQQIEAEGRRLAELAEEFRRYIYETAHVDAKAIALLEAAGK